MWLAYAFILGRARGRGPLARAGAHRRPEGLVRSLHHLPGASLRGRAHGTRARRRVAPAPARGEQPQALGAGTAKAGQGKRVRKWSEKGLEQRCLDIRSVLFPSFFP